MSPSKIAWDEDDFHRWRPSCHLLAPHGWLNDPCAPSYNSATRTYYIGFQWNPRGWDWGNISWGAATSKDLINWTVSPVPSIEPLSEAGVFTGCMVPESTIKSQCSRSGSTLNIFYTSAQRLPIHYTRDYDRGCEQIHAAKSNDGGLTWCRDARNPVLPGPPKHLTVTGWRDPSIFTWECYDKAMGRSTGSGLYGIVAGGIKHDSPTVFLYDCDCDDLMRWTFLTTLIRPGLNFTADAESDLGVNWEVANVMTLYDDEHNPYQVIIVGVEGCEVDTTNSDPVTREKRVGRAQKWICTTIGPSAASEDTAASSAAPHQLVYDFSGTLDWGMYYAANSFWDPVSQSRIVHGWVLEEDLSADLCKRQGWSGMISLGRTLQMKTYRNVVDVPGSMPGWKKRHESDGSLSLVTLVAMPEPRLAGLRVRAIEGCLSKLLRVLSYRGAATPLVRLTDGLPSLELDLSFDLHDETGDVGIDIFHSDG
jgi:beta-fructofuranosidase